MTILGKHTISELRDLLKAYDYQFDELSRAFDTASSEWANADTGGRDTWKRDFDAWNASTWQPARNRANTSLAGTATSLQDITTDEPTYQATATAFAPLVDFDRRLRTAPKAAAAYAPDYKSNPQPTAVDADLGAYKSADASTKVIEAAAKAANPLAGLSTTQKILYGAAAFVGLALFVKIAK
jgi:hypothetical protein